MLGIDTNVLVRLLVADSIEQAEAASKLLEGIEARGERVFVNRLVLAECLWVLTSRYELSRAGALDLLKTLVDHPILALEDADAVRAAVMTADTSRQQLVDLIVGITNAAKGCKTTFTFDRTAARDQHFTLVP